MTDVQEFWEQTEQVEHFAARDADNMSQSYLVTGGAGFLGINLIRHLLLKGQRVTSFDIAPFNYDDVKDRVHIITGDIRDERAFGAALEGIDVVIHAAAALPLYTPQDIFSTNMDGTRYVLQQGIFEKDRARYSCFDNRRVWYSGSSSVV